MALLHVNNLDVQRNLSDTCVKGASLRAASLESLDRVATRTMKPGEVVSNPKPGCWGPVRSVARSVARRGPRRRGSACLALRIRAVRIRHINDTSIKNRRCTGSYRLHPRTPARPVTSHARTRAERRRRGGGPPAGPARGSRTVGTVPRASRGLALPERVYTQATPACQLSTIVQKTSTTNLLRRAAPTAHFQAGLSVALPWPRAQACALEGLPYVTVVGDWAWDWMNETLHQWVQWAKSSHSDGGQGSTEATA